MGETPSGCRPPAKSDKVGETGDSGARNHSNSCCAPAAVEMLRRVRGAAHKSCRVRSAWRANFPATRSRANFRGCGQAQAFWMQTVTTRRVPQSWNSISRLSMLLLEPIETKDFAKRVHRFLVRDFPEVFALHLLVLIEELLFCFIAN